MDREAWRAVIHGVAKSGHDWATHLIWSDAPTSNDVRVLIVSHPINILYCPFFFVYFSYFNCIISQRLFSLHIPADYNVEHLFIYLLTIYISSFMNYLFRTFAYFYSGLFVFLSLSCRNSSYTLIMTPLSVTCIVNFSSQSFHSLNDTFWWICL